MRKNKNTNMKRLLLFLTLFVSIRLDAQIAPSKFWIQFTDKNNTPYSIDNPEEFLSERAIQRRLDYNIAIDEYDLPINPLYIEAVENAGATILNPSKWLNGVSVEITDPSVLEKINELTFVEKTRVLEDEPLKHLIKKRRSSAEVADVIADLSKSSLRNYYGYAYDHINQLNGIELHNRGYRGEGMLIGLCDGGYDDADTHVAFDAVRNDNRLVATRDFIHGNGDVYSASSHGTSCWSLMAGNVTDEFVGTAPMASYVLCRTEDVGSENVIEEYNWVSAAEYLDSLGVDVISTSLGYITFDDDAASHIYGDLDGKTAVITIGSEIAASKGVLCVTSAGNDGDTDFPYVSAPADGENVLTVGAVGSDGERAYFSSVGPTYDGRIKPDLMAHGYNTVVAAYNNAYYQGSGTSFACPVLAGMVACLWQANKHLPAKMIVEALKQNASYSSNPNNEYGYGIPDMMEILYYIYVKENNVDENAIVAIFPNPSNGNVNVNIKEDVNVRIYNQLGTLLYDNAVNLNTKKQLEYVLSNLNGGLYIVNVNGKSGFQTVKFIKY